MSTQAELKGEIKPEDKQKHQWVLKDFLVNFHCISPLFPNDWANVVRIYERQTVSEAFKKMIDYHLLSLPIVDNNGKPLYVLSMMDILSIILKKFSESDCKKPHFYQALSNWLLDTTGELTKKELRNIEDDLNYELDPAYTVAEHDSLLNAVQLMVEHKCHRVLVYSDTGKLSSLITQSRVLQFISSMVDHLAVGGKTVEQLGLGLKPVVSVPKTATAYQAFSTMISNKISGMAIVDENGVLIGTISDSDIKRVGYDLKFFDLLGKPVLDYVNDISKHPQNIRSHMLIWAQRSDMPQVIVTCSKSSPLSYILRLISYYKVHRIYVVDEKNHPVSVISLVDILKVLLESENLL